MLVDLIKARHSSSLSDFPRARAVVQKRPRSFGSGFRVAFAVLRRLPME